MSHIFRAKHYAKFRDFGKVAQSLMDYEEAVHMSERRASTERETLQDFVRGQKDCKRGIEHKSGSAAYNRGYAAQYELEQMNTERTSRGK